MKNHSRSHNPKRDSAYRTPSRLRALRAYEEKVSVKRLTSLKDWRRRQSSMPQSRSEARGKK